MVWVDFCPNSEAWDRRALLDAWEEMGWPPLPLSPGTYIYDLECWLDNTIPPVVTHQQVRQLRRTIEILRDDWDYLLGCEPLEEYLARRCGVTPDSPDEFCAVMEAPELYQPSGPLVCRGMVRGLL
jgi:hypothetical protein